MRQAGRRLQSIGALEHPGVSPVPSASQLAWSSTAVSHCPARAVPRKEGRGYLAHLGLKQVLHPLLAVASALLVEVATTPMPLHLSPKDPCLRHLFPRAPSTTMDPRHYLPRAPPSLPLHPPSQLSITLVETLDMALIGSTGAGEWDLLPTALLHGKMACCYQGKPHRYMQWLSPNLTSRSKFNVPGGGFSTSAQAPASQAKDSEFNAWYKQNKHKNTT